jgi:nucleotide-binding universal stress UspA family protein
MKRREYTLVVVAGAIVAAVVGERLVLSPLVGAWQGLKERVSAQQGALVAAQALVKRADTIQARYRSSARTVEGDPDTRAIEFLAFLHAAAGRAGVKVTAEKPSPPVWRGQQVRRGSVTDRGVGHAECTVNLTFTSSLEAVVRFLTELAAGEEAVRVLTLTVIAQDPGGQSLGVTLRLSTVILPVEARQPTLSRAGQSLSPMAFALGGAGWGGEAGETLPEDLEREAGGGSDEAERMEARP